MIDRNCSNIESVDFGLSLGALAEIGRLAIKMQQANEAAQEHRERAVAEGWDNDPTGSSWIQQSVRDQDEACNAFLAKLHEHGLTAAYQHDSGVAGCAS